MDEFTKNKKNLKLMKNLYSMSFSFLILFFFTFQLILLFIVVHRYLIIVLDVSYKT